MAREGVPLDVIQRQLGHANLGVTSIYLQGIDTAEIVHTVRSRPRPGHSGGCLACAVVVLLVLSGTSAPRSRRSGWTDIGRFGSS
jgi:hypothetical protein